ncbi:metal-dependent hydrolase [Clavibacter sp. Sh2126]|uniref:metal-dependent hydrolase n=1 Tax=Clavibacter sp. Sh2126 TaxID=3397678 RepID=UPI0039E04CC0
MTSTSDSAAAPAASLPPTRVTYPAGSTSSRGTVLRVDRRADGTLAVVLDATACHPVDSAWPDQPADRAVLRVRGAGIEVLDCVVGAASTDPGEGVAALHVGAEVPVKKGADGWSFVAVHLVPGDADVREGDAAEVAVDPEHRRALSAGHTGCHLASLALDRALADAWTKEVPTDALGAPGFDALAIDTSRIGPWSSIDTYRLGKSLRKKGFPTAALVEHLDEVRERVDATLAAWVASAAPARIEREGDLLTSRRSWVCELQDGTARIPCGGTHLDGLAALASVTVELEAEEADGAVVVRMRTACVPA